MGIKDLISKYEGGNFSKTGWFQLKDDGDTAVVRFLDKGEVGIEANGEPKYDFDIHEVHKMDVDGSGKDRTVLCKGEQCELCKAGNKPSLRMFLQMVNLDETDKEKQLQLWERGVNDIKTILGFCGEYGALNDRNFKIKRNGAKGNLKTTYQYFPQDKSPMELPEKQELVGTLILDLTREEQIKAIEGRLETKKATDNADNAGSTSSTAGRAGTRAF